MLAILTTWIDARGQIGEQSVIEAAPRKSLG